MHKTTIQWVFPDLVKENTFPDALAAVTENLVTISYKIGEAGIEMPYINYCDLKSSNKNDDGKYFVNITFKSLEDAVQFKLACT